MYGILDTTKNGRNKTKPENLELEEVSENSNDLNNSKFESFVYSYWL